MRDFLQRRPVRICRVVFRWMRICVWFVVFVMVAAAAYLHLIGLPGLVKARLTQELKARGVEVRFRNAVLGWGPDVVIEDSSFRRVSQQPEPQLWAGRAAMTFSLRELLHRRVSVTSLNVEKARVQFPGDAETPAMPALADIELDMTFLSNDVVRVANGAANFAGLQIAISGQISHVMSVRDWQPARGGGGDWRRFMDQMAAITRQIHFAKAPRLELQFRADGRDPNSVRLHLALSAPDVATPWGDGRNLHLWATAQNLFETNQPVARIELGAGEAATRWAQGQEVSLTAAISRDGASNLQSSVQLAAAELDGDWRSNAVHVSSFKWDGAASLAGTNFHLLTAAGALQAAKVETPWGSAHTINLSLRGDAAAVTNDAAADWGFWAGLTPWSLQWTLAVVDVDSPKLQLETLSLSGQWRAPKLEISRVEAGLYQGRVTGGARLDVAARELVLDTVADFDAHKIEPLLSPQTRHLLSQYDWKTPPHAEGELRMTLPAWTNRHPDWAGEVGPTVQAAGDFSGRQASFRGIPVDAARSHFTYTNRVWDLPRLVAERGGETLVMAYTNNDATHAYYFRFDSQMNPQAVRTLVPESQRHWFDEAAFTVAPMVHAEVWGHWGQPEETGFRGDIAATNFTVRGERVDSLSARLEHDGPKFSARDLAVTRGAERASAKLVEVDIATKTVLFNDAISSLDPAIVPRLFGPQSPKFLEEIKFDVPPTVRADGSYQWNDPLATRLRFAVSGRQFHWSHLTADEITGNVDWRARDVVLTNVNARLYRTGSMLGWCVFDYLPTNGTDFHGDCLAEEIDLSALARGLTGKTNKLEGKMDGELVIDSGNSEDRRSAQGHGHVFVHDALLWDIKVFGIVSDALDAIAPGAGHSRAYEASAPFVLTNGVIGTDDLEIHSTGFRLLYRGTVDAVSKKIDARAEAELFRDTWALGPALSVALAPLSKLFEYQITGDLDNPKKEPVFIPRPLMMIFRPFHTLKSIFTGGDDSSPPAAAPPKK